MLRAAWRSARRYGLLRHAFACALLALWTSAVAVADPHLTLSYGQPASDWSEALPLGNGRLGAMVFGGTETERLQINEGTLWGGSPKKERIAPGASRLAEVRQRVFAGDIEAAEKAARGLLGDSPLLAPYQPFCDLRLHFADHGQVRDYRRELRLEDAVSTVSYRIADTVFRREMFVSYPDRVLVMQLTADKPASQSLTIGIDSPHRGVRAAVTGTNGIHITGQILPRTNPESSWIGSWNVPGLKFAAHLLVRAQGGTIRKLGDQLEVTDADSVTLLFGNATSFRSYEDIGADADRAASRLVSLASRRSYEELKRRHIADFNALFSRVRLQLGPAVGSQLNTDERLRDFSTTQDPDLVALYYQFGRYLLISSSRPGGQPANLQGLWNQELQPPWGSKWTTNINLEMNYWPSDSGNLWETQIPLWNLIRDLRVTGSRTARLLYRSDGWVLHHNTDLWRSTTPVDGVWGLWPLGAVWLSNQMWDHYEFSRDRRFLRRQAYPAMKEAAEFVLHSLLKAPAGTAFAGKLVTNPSTSPENQYVLDGFRAYLTYAPSMDIELITELFEHCQRAGEELGVDREFRAELARSSALLPPLQIGQRGQLQEWIQDYAEVEPDHRHTSHLYALYPGSTIDPDTTPQLAAAARRSLELRGDGRMGGWPKAWRVALWARLRDGEQSYLNLRSLISENSWPDMLNFGPPFQIDGNLGGAAGIAEMLLQSKHGEILLMPAVPALWRSGKLEGFRVRGAASVGIEWFDGKLTRATLRSDADASFRIRYEDRSAVVRLLPGQTLTLDEHLNETTN